MTNEQIVKKATARLVSEGKLKSGEEIHTYHQWKKLGYQVFRGEKAIASLDIWRFFQNSDEKKDEDGDGEEEKKDRKNGRMQMQKAYFFSTSQVYAIEAV